MKKTIVDPEFIKAMHANTSVDDHAVVIIELKLTREKNGYKEEILQINSFAEGIYEAFECFGVDYKKGKGKVKIL